MNSISENKKTTIRTVFFKDDSEIDMFIVKNQIDWEKIASLFNKNSNLEVQNKKNIPVAIKFLTAYYNSQAYKVKENKKTIDQFYNFIVKGNNEAQMFKGFIFDLFFNEDINVNLNSIKKINNHIIKNNLLDEILLEGNLLDKDDYDYSRADTTNRYLGII